MQYLMEPEIEQQTPLSEETSQWLLLEKKDWNCEYQLGHCQSWNHQSRDQCGDYQKWRTRRRKSVRARAFNTSGSTIRADNSRVYMLLRRWSRSRSIDALSHRCCSRAEQTRRHILTNKRRRRLLLLALSGLGGSRMPGRCVSSRSSRRTSGRELGVL
jgi:hypothetical protein